MIFTVDNHLHNTFQLLGIFDGRLHSRNDYIAFLLILKILDCVAWLLAPYFFEIWKFLPSHSHSPSYTNSPSTLHLALCIATYFATITNFLKNCDGNVFLLWGMAGGRGIIAFDKLSFLNQSG